MEIQKADFSVCADSLMDAVSLPNHAVILTADAVIHIDFAVEVLAAFRCRNAV